MTRILAFETAGQGGSVAALVDGALALERDLPSERRSAQTLAAGLCELLSEVGWRPGDVELVAVARGPGSFTGLRVGVTTAKMLAYAIGCPLLGVSTLETIASRAPRGFARLSVAMDAERGELYVGRFAGPDPLADLDARDSREPRSAPADSLDSRSSPADSLDSVDSAERSGGLSWVGEPAIVGAEAFLAGLAPGEGVTGPALRTLEGRLPAQARVAPREFWSPSAAAVGRLAWREFLAGRRDDPFQLAPLYLRRTAAEEQWDRRPAT